MPSLDADGRPLRSKIASIQEFTNFPQAEMNLGPEEIDLPVRDGFALHTLVGLNVFLIKIAQQFPDILGIRTQDPMLVSRGVDPLIRTEEAMLDMAATRTVELSVSEVSSDAERLRATVELDSKVGHKFPSGVGFRRAFLAFEVLDQRGEVLWASGRTNALGVLIGPDGAPLATEFFERDDQGRQQFQPHHAVIDSEKQVQVYETLIHNKKRELTTSFIRGSGIVKDVAQKRSLGRFVHEIAQACRGFGTRREKERVYGRIARR